MARRKKEPKTLHQIRVTRKGKPEAWVYKRGGKFLLVLEQWHATRFRIREADALIKVLRAALPGIRFSIADLMLRPPLVKDFKRREKPKVLQDDYVPLFKPVETRNPFPEGEIDFNAEQFKVNEPVDCRNCGICRVCLGL